ncbi:hypothetical protein KY362_04150 [Candidatus Woesearchaeota archaeon]|nr:hypothetical protein [Candidatus Woesearchaeota archaeon]
MEKVTMLAIVAAVVMVVGAVFVAADFMQGPAADSGETGGEGDAPSASGGSCGAGSCGASCDGSCGGRCGAPTCGCGR